MNEPAPPAPPAKPPASPRQIATAWAIALAVLAVVGYACVTFLHTLDR
jgi:hypothetical protein